MPGERASFATTERCTTRRSFRAARATRGMIFIPGDHRRTRAHTGQIVAALEVKLAESRATRTS